MAVKSNARIQFRYGLCLNTRGGCSKAKTKEVQKISVHKKLVCEECGKDLKECPPPVSWWDKYGKLTIGSVAALTVIGGGAAYFLSAPASIIPESVVSEITAVTLGDVDPMIWVGTTDTLSVTPTPADAKATYVWSSSNESVAIVKDGIVKVVGEGETTITVKVQGKEDISASAKFYAENYEETDEQSGEEKENKEGKTNLPSGKIDLGFATYEGDTKNGKPEGNGTMTFKTRHIIPGAKGDVEAQPGEYVTGTWRNGEVNVVTLYQKNGNKPVIMHR